MKTFIDKTQDSQVLPDSILELLKQGKRTLQVSVQFKPESGDEPIEGIVESAGRYTSLGEEYDVFQIRYLKGKRITGRACPVADVQKISVFDGKEYKPIYLRE